MGNNPAVHASRFSPFPTATLDAISHQPLKPRDKDWRRYRQWTDYNVILILHLRGIRIREHRLQAMRRRGYEYVLSIAIHNPRVFVLQLDSQAEPDALIVRHLRRPLKRHSINTYRSSTRSVGEESDWKPDGWSGVGGMPAAWAHPASRGSFSWGHERFSTNEGKRCGRHTKFVQNYKFIIIRIDIYCELNEVFVSSVLR